MRKPITQLRRKGSIVAIEHTEKVMLRVGVWNSYERTDTKTAIKCIENSGYGADVFFDSEDAMYYVSIPTASDMW